MKYRDLAIGTIYGRKGREEGDQFWLWSPKGETLFKKLDSFTPVDLSDDSFDHLEVLSFIPTEFLE